MRSRTPLVLLMLVSLVAMLPSCGRKVEFEDAARIVERRVGHERFEGGAKKWEMFEIIGPDSPYTDRVNKEFRGSDGRRGAGQPGKFTVFNGTGSVTGEYAAIDEISYMVIPVQNRELQNAVIVCRTATAK